MKKSIALTASLFLTFSGFAQVEKDLLPQGDLYISPYFTGVNFNEVYDNDGEKKPVPEASSFSYNLFLKYGISNKWNVSINAPFLISNTANGNALDSSLQNVVKVDQKRSGSGDILIGVNYGFFESGSWKAIAGFYQGIPTAINDDPYGLNTGYADFNQKITFDLRYKPGQNWYIKGIAGFNNHNKGYGDEIHGRLDIAAQALKGLWVKVSLVGIQPLEHGDLKEKPVESDRPTIAYGKYYGLYAQHAGSYIFSPEIKYHFNSLFSVFASAGFIIKAQNMNGGTSFSGGLCLNFSRKEKEIKEEKSPVKEKSDEVNKEEKK